MCIDSHQTGFVGKGSDYLQLIKFWPSCAPEKGVCGRAKIFGSALLQPARSVCVFLNAFFIAIVFKFGMYCFSQFSIHWTLALDRLLTYNTVELGYPMTDE